MTDVKKVDLIGPLGKFVWYYHDLKPGAGISAPMPRTDGRPLDGTIVGVNEDGTVEVRIWAGGTPHVLDKVQIYAGEVLGGGNFVIYPADDKKRGDQATEKANKEATAAAVEAFNQERDALRKAAEEKANAKRA